jgi:hypothetical protein
MPDLYTSGFADRAPQIWQRQQCLICRLASISTRENLVTQTGEFGAEATQAN